MPTSIGSAPGQQRHGFGAGRGEDQIEVGIAKHSAQQLVLVGVIVDHQQQSLRLVVRSIIVDTYQATPRSNLFQRNTTGEALNSSMPRRMRVLSSILGWLDTYRQ